MPFRNICWTPRCKTVRDVLSHCCIDVFLMGSPFGVDVFLVCCTVVAADPGMRGVTRRRWRCCCWWRRGPTCTSWVKRINVTVAGIITQIYKRQRSLFSSIWIYSSCFLGSCHTCHKHTLHGPFISRMHKWFTTYAACLLNYIYQESILRSDTGGTLYGPYISRGIHKWFTIYTACLLDYTKSLSRVVIRLARYYTVHI
jgi:hypothetical protein